MKHYNYAIIGFIACLLFSTNLRSQVLLPKNGEKKAFTSLFGSNYKLRACERFYLQFVQICEGQRFRVVDSFYTRAGTYTNTARTAEGCDSIITTILNLIPSQRTDTAAFVCFGKCFKVGTKCYTQSGNYADTLKTRFGCDSIIKLNLTVLKPDSVQQNAIICDGQSFRVGNRIYFSSGNYRDTIPNADGCFRIIKTSLTVRNKASITQNPTLCEGGRITVGTNTYDRTGVYLDTLRTVAGCDSFVTTNLKVLPSIKKTLDSMVCSGKSVLFNDTLRTTTGMYRRILRSFNGCDSTITLNLTVTPPLTSTMNMTQCSGKSVTIGGNTYNRTGTYTIPFKTAGGCDSLVVLNLIVPRPPNALRTVTLCGGKDTLIEGRRYNQTGIYRDTLKAVSGCDSLVKVLSINILPVNETYTSISFCRNVTNMISGTYRTVFTSSTGCDSIVVLTVKVSDTFNIRQTKELCVGDSLRVGNKIYKTSGNYTDVLKTVDGCDSTIFTNLKILGPLSITQSKSLCKGESLRVGNKTYNTAGTYVDKLTSVKGCDSTVTSIIKVVDVPVLILPQGLKPKFCSDSLALNPKGDTASKYTWQWKTVPCATCLNPKIKPIQTTTYYVTVTDKTTSCTTSDSVKIVMDGTYEEKIPNAFTPNGDNLNDVFNIAPDDCIKSVKRLQIFSRIGDLVFDKTNLSPRNNEGWNGLSKDSPLGADVYIYVMEIAFSDGTTKKVSGEVNLIH